MALMKTTTEPNPIPNPSTSELLTLGDELDPGCAEDVGKLAPPSDVVIPVVEVEVVVIDDVPVVDSELAEEDVDVVEIEVIVVGVMCPKMDAATEDICGSATAWIPLQSATRGCFKGACASSPVVSWAHSATRATRFAASLAAFHGMAPKTPNRMAVTAPKTSRNHTRMSSGRL